MRSKAKFKDANYNLIQRRDDEIARRHHLRNMSNINSKNTKVTVKKTVEHAESVGIINRKFRGYNERVKANSIFKYNLKLMENLH